MRLFAFSIIVFLFLTSFPTKKLSPLTLPTISTVQAPEPLAMKTKNISVLGAQTIDAVDFVNEINGERQKIQALPLRLSTVLSHAAKLRANVILKHQNFSHQDPYEGIELGTILPQLNYHYVYASENIGMGGLSAKDFVNGFMNSTTHRENLLNPKLTETGAAFVSGPYKQYYVNIAVQLFAIPGGMDEYLGYTTKEKSAYEQAYSTLHATVHPARLFTQKLFRNPKYSQAQITKWNRQREILNTVIAKMRKNLPLASSDVALIFEYNDLL